MLYHTIHRRFLMAGIINLFAVFLFANIVLAEEQDVSSTSIYTGAIGLTTRGIDGGLTNGESLIGAVTPNFSCVVLNSYASNLVSGDSNSKRDMFLAHGVNQPRQLLHSSSFDTAAIWLSNDCTKVLFLRKDGLENDSNLYLLDILEEKETLVSRDINGQKAGGALSGVMTANYQTIFFASVANNLVPEDKTVNKADIYEFEISTGYIKLASLNSAGEQANDISSTVRVSPDNNLIVFYSSGKNFPNDDESSNKGDVFLRNLSTGETISLSESLPNLTSSQYAISYFPIRVTENGQFVFFRSSSNANTADIIYKYELATNILTSVGSSTSLAGILISNDGSVLVTIKTFTPAYSHTISYLCLYKFTITQEGECLYPSNSTSRQSFDSFALSGDGNKLLFASETHEWIQSTINREEADIFFWDRTQTASISGKVTGDSDEPLGNVIIKYDDGMSVKTSSNGQFVIKNIFDGQHIITPTLTGKTFYPPNATVTVPPSKREVNFSTKQLKQSVVVFIPGIGGSQLVRKVDNWFDEYLWPVIPDAPKKKMTLKPGMEDASIYTDDVVRNFYLFKFYGPFLNTLVSNGYNEYLVDGNPNKRRLSNDCDKSQESATLFVFPWDWRYGIADTVNPSIALSPNNIGLLHEFVQCILRIKGENIEITVIAHSMGGMLTTQYLLKYPADHYIKRVISVGTPYLGAPKAIAAILAGEFDPRIISPGTAKTLLEYFPGAHQLIPNKRYFELAELSPLATYDLLAVGGRNFTFSPVKYENLQSTLKARYKSTDKDAVYPTTVNFMANNEVVSSNPNFTDWSSKPFGVEYHILYGIQQNPWTIGQVKDKVIVYNNGSDIVQGTVVYKDEYAYQMVFGDDTVPIVSASRIGKDGENLNGGIKPLAFKQRKGEDALEHSKLLSNKRIQNCIFFILGKSTTACEDDDLSAVSASNALDVGARYINLWGVTSLRITNGVSTTDELITSTASLENTFPKIKMQFMGSNALSLLLPEDESYMLRAITDEYLQVESAVGNGGTTNQFISYVDVPVEVKSVIDINAASIVPIALLIDTNADHLPDTPVPPTAILTGNEVSDTVPPTVTISLDTQQQTAVIGATDDLSGIARIFYSTNGVDYSRYTAPFKLSVGKTKLYAQAEDKAGNMSSILIQEVVVRDPVQPQPTFSLFLPLVKR